MSKSVDYAADKDAHYQRCDFQVHSPRDRQWTGAARTADEERAEYAAGLIAACRPAWSTSTPSKPISTCGQ